MVNVGVLKKANVILHGAQGLWSVVIMGVIGSSMAQNGPSSSAAHFIFAMCWLNLPILVYLTMAPRYMRTQMFAHPYWVIAMNSLYSLFWFAGFIALSVYTKKGISAGEQKEKDPKLKSLGGCAVFTAGTGEAEKACHLNRTTVGLSVIMWFLWLATMAIAGYAAWYFKKNTISPFEDLQSPSHEIQETTKDAFSSNEEYAPINGPITHDNHEEYDDYDIESRPGQGHGRTGSVASSTYSSSAYTYDQAHPGRAVSWAAERVPYAGIGGHAPIAPAHGEVSMPDLPEDYSYKGPRR